MAQGRPAEPSAPASGQGRLHCSGIREAITLQMQQVHYFLALCEELNFTRAGRRCGVSQPTLTNQAREVARLLTPRPDGDRSARRAMDSSEHAPN